MCWPPPGRSRAHDGERRARKTRQPCGGGFLERRGTDRHEAGRDEPACYSGVFIGMDEPPIGIDDEPFIGMLDELFMPRGAALLVIV